MEPMQPNPNSPVEALSYEAALNELESVVAGLESGENSLEQALALYERGQALASHCAHLLDQAELRVRVLSGEQLSDLEIEP
jgi:exodeoxyribonuclease VII small subunit